ncbi:MAG: hypothetical protein FWG44_06225 [Oscillospiraceae bacterium]|nr:hypothetical protein [Oscillospiraceae bacterium]
MEKNGTEVIPEMVKVDSDELNKEQMKAFQSGKPIEFSGGLSEDAMADIAAMDAMDLSDLLPPEPASPEEPGQTVSMPAEPAGSENQDNLISESGEVEFNPDIHSEEKIIIKQGVTELKRFEIPRAVKRTILVVFALIAAFALGFCVHFIMASEIFPGYVNETGYKCAAATLNIIPKDKEFMIFDIYVKKDAETTECIVFGVLSEAVNNFNPTYYRFIINNSDSEDTNVYLPFDPEKHSAYKQGSDQERMAADTMMSYYNAFLRSVDEINAGSERWQRADIAYIKTRLAKEK